MVLALREIAIAAVDANNIVVFEGVLSLLDKVDKASRVWTIEKTIDARGDTYSRTGLYALARFYDRWSDHARSLDLPALFHNLGVERVAWYCDLRERYPELTSPDLWNALGHSTLPDTQFGSLKLAPGKEVASEIWRRWPNRGDSIFLDYLIFADDPPT
jgi:hypothetical protein